MVFVWVIKMRIIIFLLLSTVFVLADKNGNRRTKPFIADAVGNTLPPPSNVPATVGSPISLLTPDKYEFYTFDESGELVKRLMTLEEIQAIVAAGEDSEGLVTFANDNHPTIAFNFSQPPYTKVHSVVTNVQNVLKAQMEAHKNKPLVQPTLDTPDVSDSWSLILPSIFGNTGVDIVPDKPASSFTPETDTLEENFNVDDGENSLSKEADMQVTNSDPVVEENYNVTEVNILDKTTTSPATSPTTTTSTTTTTVKPSTTRKVISPKPTRASTPSKKIVTTTRPRTTTTKLTLTTTTQKSTTVTTEPSTTRNIPSTTLKPVSSTKKQPLIITTTTEYISNDIPTSKPLVQFEKLSTFTPTSTVKYITERSTKIPIQTTKAPFVYASTTKRSPYSTNSASRPLSSTQAQKQQPSTVSPISSTHKIYVTPTSRDPEMQKNNVTTITTQSISPSSTASTTEFIPAQEPQNDFGMKDDDPIIPLFDVAQSISQIASDLGNNYQPIPTTSNLLETTQFNVDNMESKENVEIEIPNDTSNVKENLEDNFVKISTIDPHPPKNVQTADKDIKIIDHQHTQETTEVITTTENTEFTSLIAQSTTIDPILSESMEDLLSQVSDEIPQSLLDSDKSDSTTVITTEQILDTTTDSYTDLNSEISTTISEDITTLSQLMTTTEKLFVEIKKETPATLSTNTPNHVNTSNSNKLQSEKNSMDSNEDFVQITMSTSPPKIGTTEKVTDVSTKYEKNSTDSDKFPLSSKIPSTNQITIINLGQKDKAPVSEGPTTSKIDITTKLEGSSNLNNKTGSESSGASTNKIDGDQLINKDEKTEQLTKVDEFKKKIQKVNDEEIANDRDDSWKLVPTVIPPKGIDKVKADNTYISSNDEHKNVVLEFSQENQGLEVTTKDLGEDIAQFTELCNELAFRYWNVMVENIDKRRSFVLSPYSITSMLAMMFMGARGATSGEMNEILKLDDMVTFNPHFTLKNISDSIESSSSSGAVVSAFVRELFSDRTKGKILTFYKERAQHFYNGHVEEVNFKLIGDIIRRRTNLLVKKHTWGKIPEYMKTNSVVMKPPLAAFSANIFQTDCTGTSVDGRDGEMYFVVSPNVRQRRLVPVPAVVYKSGFIAGYDPVLDATAAALGSTNSIVSIIFLMPGQQGNIVHADDLEKLERRLLETNPTKPTWSRLLRTLLPRVGLELQIPRFSHKSIFNVSSTLREMGLKDLFDSENADLGGLNGPSKDLYLSDMIQVSSFVTCGEGMIGEQHHVEEYPETLSETRVRTARWADWDEPRDYQRAFHDPHDVGEAMHLPLHLRPRQARLPTRSVQPARLKFDRPFLFFVRHNPSGMILYVGRYNPRLLP